MAKPFFKLDEPYSPEEINGLECQYVGRNEPTKVSSHDKRWIPTVRKYQQRIAELKSMVDFWDKVSERRYSAYAKLGRIWAKAVGKEGMIPDTGKLLNWLAEYIEQLETNKRYLEGQVRVLKGGRIAELEAALDDIEQKTEGADEDEPPKSLLVLFLEINDIAREAREGGKG